MTKEITKGTRLKLPATTTEDLYYDVKAFADEDTINNGGKKVTIPDECIELIKLGVEYRKAKK